MTARLLLLGDGTGDGKVKPAGVGTVLVDCGRVVVVVVSVVIIDVLVSEN